MARQEITVQDRGEAVWQSFGSIGEMQVAYRRAVNGPVLRGSCEYGPDAKRNNFYGESTMDTLRLIEEGDRAGVKKSDKMLNTIEGRVQIDTQAFKTRAAVAGGAVNVGAYLAGSPLSMRQRRRVIDDMSPVAVLIDITVSSGTSASEILRRGSAALALTRLVSQARPVSLHVISGMKSRRTTSLFSVQIDTAPLDLGRASFCMCRPEMLRRALFSLHSENLGEATGNIEWAFNSHGWQHRDLPAEMARRLGCTDYVAVPGTIHGMGGSRDTDAAAAEWVATEANRLLARRESEAA